MCLALGVGSLDEAGRKLGDVLEMQPPQGLAEKVKGLRKLKSIADSQPKRVRSGPSQEVVLTGDDVDLGRLPVQTCWPGDAAPFITLPAVITKDPRDGSRNVGMYRMQVLDGKTTAMHWQIHKDGRADYLLAEGRMDVAVAIGLDPVTAYAASAPLPKNVDELMLAGFLRGEPVELVPAKTVDLEVPANAEIVLEGYIAKDDLTSEGPFGDHTGYYTPPELFPVFHVEAITMRRDAIYPSIVVGKPPAEDAWLGKATERIFLPAIRMSVPEIVDYDLPVAGAFHNCCLVSIRKTFPGQAQKVMHAIWGLGLLSLTKAVVVVDECGRRARLPGRFLPGLRERRPEAGRAPLRGAARPPRPRALDAVLRWQDRDRRHSQGPGRGCAALAGGDSHERRGARPRRRPLGGIRPRKCSGSVAPVVTSLTP